MNVFLKKDGLLAIPLIFVGLFNVVAVPITAIRALILGDSESGIFGLIILLSAALIGAFVFLFVRTLLKNGTVSRMARVAAYIFNAGIVAALACFFALVRHAQELQGEGFADLGLIIGILLVLGAVQILFTIVSVVGLFGLGAFKKKSQKNLQ